MKIDRIKALQLSSELVDYFLQNHIAQVHMDMDFQQDHFTIEVSGRTQQPPDDLYELTEALHEVRQPEMDEYYDALIGCEFRDQGFHMLGALVDESEVRFREGLLTIKIRRNGHFTY